MKVNEIVYSIQGEGLYQGIPMVFVRLQGCNLLTPCSYCDTLYARDGSLGKELDEEEIAQEVVAFSPHYQDWVCITGGEPLFQESELFKLVKKLRNYGYRITIETNGSIRKPNWWSMVHSWVADIKCPSSGVCGTSVIHDWMEMRQDDQIKFVVGTMRDLDFAKEVMQNYLWAHPVILISPVILQPQAILEGYWKEREWLQTVAEFCKEMRVRMSLQIQKVIWGNQKGV